MLYKPIILEVVDKSDDLNYYPYHHRLSYTIDDSLTFKNWLEHCLQTRAIVLSKDYLTKQPSIMDKMIFKEESNPLMDG